MKKFLFVLFIAAAALTGCKKDTDPTVHITQTDLALINQQLAGTWLFPVETVSVVDDSGKQLLPNQTETSSAFQFDGISTVTIMPGPGIKEKGFYSLSTSNGFIYVTVLSPDGNTTVYKLLYINDKTLKLNAAQPYLYYDGNTAVVANAIINQVFKKQDAFDVSGKTVNISILSDATFDASVYAVRAGDTVLLDTQTRITKNYTFAYQAKSGDHLLLDLLGTPAKISFSAYYKGVPLTGKFITDDYELRTTTGWNIP